MIEVEVTTKLDSSGVTTVVKNEKIVKENGRIRIVL